MSSTIKKNNFKPAFLLILLAIFISCKTTLKANDINTSDLNNFIINEKPDNFYSFEWQHYTVLTGDSISEIAEKFGISAAAIIAINKLIDINSLQPGMVLRIPNMDGILYQFKENDSFAEISSEYKVPLELILAVNDINYNNIKHGEIIFLPIAAENKYEPPETSPEFHQKNYDDYYSYPLHTQNITSYFGNRRINYAIQFHDGLDFSARIGETVMAAMDGVVTIAVYHRQHGNYIVISHSNGYKTLYSHLSAFNVKEGDLVKRGQKIAESGNTGNSTGPHLHFSIYDTENNAVDPLELLREETVSGE